MFLKMVFVVVWSKGRTNIYIQHRRVLKIPSQTDIFHFLTLSAMVGTSHALPTDGNCVPLLPVSPTHRGADGSNDTHHIYNMNKINIAIDGFSSCGKSTMAKALARKIGYTYIDSGAMYRAVTLAALENGCFDADGKVNEQRVKDILGTVNIEFHTDKETGRQTTKLNGKDVETQIRSMEVSTRVSLIAALPFVRTELVKQQQSMGKDKGVVMDGRDIGTAVFPDAEMKVFVTASAQVRAERRYEELKAKGQIVDLDEIRRNIEQRDYIDQHREVSPLRRADDALLLDNSYMSIAEQDEWLMAEYRKACGIQ